MEELCGPEGLCFLRTCREETLRQFQQRGKLMRYPKGHICIRAREREENVFFLLEGKVQIYNLTRDGKKKILHILGRNHIANEGVAAGYNTVFCETLEPCTFFVLQQSMLLSLMEQDFQLTLALLQYQEQKLWRLGHQLKNTFGSIYLERKLASKLWKLGRDFGVQEKRGLRIDLELSVTFLADLLGAPRENTSRACKKLTELGLITMEKKRIYIPDAERMAAFYKTGEISSK